MSGREREVYVLIISHAPHVLIYSLQCTWNRSSPREPRTEQHFQARGEHLRKVLVEYQSYTDYLESILGQQITGDIDFRALRPSISDVPTKNEARDEFMMDIKQDEESESDDLFKGLTVNHAARVDCVVMAVVFFFRLMKADKSFIMAIQHHSAFGQKDRPSLLDVYSHCRPRIRSTMRSKL